MKIETVGQLVDNWQKRWPREDPGTNVRNANAVRPFGIEYEHTRLADVDRSLARKVALEAPGRTRYLRAMFYDALRDGLVDENPFAALRISAPKGGPIVPPTAAELAQLIAAAETASPPLATMIPFTAYTGLRIGEGLAVSSEDLRFGAEGPVVTPGARVAIDWQITRQNKVKRPKTGRTRVIMLPPAAAEALGRRRQEILAHRSGLETARRGRSGRLWNFTYDGWWERWRAVRDVARVDCRWHDLRHFAATYFLDAGGSVEDTARQLGCSPEEVRGRYGHPDAEKALTRLEAAVTRPKGDE